MSDLIRGRRSSLLRFPPYIGVIGSLLAGFAAGLFGVGGGALMTPMMIIIFNAAVNCSRHEYVFSAVRQCFFCDRSSAAG